MTDHEAQRIRRVQHPDSSCRLLVGLSDMADGLHAQLCELQARPSADRCDRLAINLEGALLHVRRLRERLISEGEGHGQ